MYFILAVSFGSQRSVAGKTCKAIFSEEESAANGFYWLNSNETEDPYVTFCNTSNGGGNVVSSALNSLLGFFWNEFERKKRKGGGGGERKKGGGVTGQI